jgi:acetyl esterase/lipase
MNKPVLDPQLVPLAAQAPVLSLDDTTVRLLRAQGLSSGVVQLSDAVERTDHVVSEDPRVVVRVHRPTLVEGPMPLLFSIHGGGYIFGSYEMDDPKLDRWCSLFGCIGVSVEYRLAPETPYPGPLEDCYTGLTWAWDNRAELGIDESRVVIAGVSAGGGLCAALALLARDRGEVPVTHQLLECPMIDDRQITPSSGLDELLIWSRESNTYGWRSYLGDRYGADDLPAYAAPARATAAQLAGLPEALVIVGGADGFRDEDIIYAMRMMQVGVPVALHVVPGAPHGVQMFAGTEPARTWATLVEAWLGRALAR